MDFGRADPFLYGSNSESLFSDGEQTRSFPPAPTKQADARLVHAGAADGTVPRYDQQPYVSFAASSTAQPYQLGNGAIESRSSANGNMLGVLERVGRPFTPAQWLELGNQVLIWKYFASNTAIPPNVLMQLAPATRILRPSGGFTSFPAGCFGSTAFDWGSFGLGPAENGDDKELGRCRRTDGKKWRCSRETVPDQKYCERHMNRGRRGSRKDGEGQHGNAGK